MAKRKKNKVTVAEDVVKELEGWSLGDIVWGIRPNKDVFRGEILKLIPGENLASIWCIEGNGQLICELKTLEETSTKKLMKLKASQYKLPGEE